MFSIYRVQLTVFQEMALGPNTYFTEDVIITLAESVLGGKIQWCVLLFFLGKYTVVLT